jgi:octaprenyl-diphosphate synthase
MDLGMAFQIVDDCLDYAGKEADAGKSLGTDLRQNKVTLPLIYLLDALGRRDAARLRAQLAQPLSPEEEQWIHKLVSERGVVTDALRRADGFVQSARQALRRIPVAGGRAVAAQESLDLVGDYVLRRQR